jgi:DNA end-binding protein Ku
MALRSSWKGFLRLSLVSVPVKAFTARASGSDIRLNQLHRECGSRVQYKKACPIHGEIPNDEIVKGYEYAKDQYVVIDPEEIQKLRAESDRSVGIVGFIAADRLDPIYHSGKTYYLAPDGAVGQKPYALLRQVLVEEGLHALARMVLSGRDQIVLVRPMEDLLALTVLEYAASVREPSAIGDELVDTETTEDELQLTRTLVEASRIGDSTTRAIRTSTSRS